jgi:hypothetical protein
VEKKEKPKFTRVRKRPRDEDEPDDDRDDTAPSSPTPYESYYQAYQQYYKDYYKNYPRGAPHYPAPPKRKKILGIPAWGWALGITLLLLVVVIGSCFFLWTSPNNDTKVTFTDEVIISKGGHFKHRLTDEWDGEVRVELNIESTDGDKFDVYVMDQDQYDAAYDSYREPKVFSTWYRSENTTEAHKKLDLPSRDEAFFLIIDNREFNLTAQDADPIGIVQADVKIVIHTDSGFD